MGSTSSSSHGATMSLTLKPEKDTVREENYTSILLMIREESLNKILASQIPEDIERDNNKKKWASPECKFGLKFKNKSESVHHFHGERKRKPFIHLHRYRKISEEMEHIFMLKIFKKN